ncbi:hypothetical protein DPMN_076560 [Dreissena polymorpha]|uniref:Uncharacterized protein n=1 Tax=Dreissena polymorpha TaxID=45954 RepID=A0A9D3YIW6_DREPO|nr:hypothetical protein DPMN_076560 [Dreissena polymorpha]
MQIWDDTLRKCSKPPFHRARSIYESLLVNCAARDTQHTNTLTSLASLLARVGEGSPEPMVNKRFKRAFVGELRAAAHAQEETKSMRIDGLEEIDQRLFWKKKN